MCADQDRYVRSKAVKHLVKLRKKLQLNNRAEDRGNECVAAVAAIAEETDVDSDEDEGMEDEEEMLNDDEMQCEELSDHEDESDNSFIELDESVRTVRTPDIKWRARSYHSMIDWRILVSEPPITASLSDDQLRKIEEAPLEDPGWLNHTQPVERGIKVLTEAATAVTGFDARDGFIRQRLYSRCHQPTFKNKKEYKFF